MKTDLRKSSERQEGGSLGEFGDARHGVLCGAAHDLADPLELVSLVLAGEERLPGQQLRKDAADAPDVDLGAVVRRTEDQLWWPACKADVV